MFGLFGTLFGGGYNEFCSDPTIINKKNRLFSELKRKLDKNKYLLTFDYLYKMCSEKNILEIHKEIIEIDEKIKYLESKSKDIEPVWKICSTLLAIFIPISAFINFKTISSIMNIAEDKLKLLFCIIVFGVYIAMVLLFIAFINIQNVKLYNYRLYSRVLVYLLDEKKNPMNSEININQ